MTITAPSERTRRLRVPGYLILGIALLLPLVDVFMSVMPFKPDTVAWRFGAFGLFASAVGAPLLVLFLIYGLATVFGDRKIVIVCGIISALFALLLLGGFGSFALDALQMRSRVPAAAMPKFYAASAQAVIKLSLQALAALVLTVNIFKVLRDPKFAPRKVDRSPAANLVVGRSSSLHRPIDRGDGAATRISDGGPVRNAGDIAPPPQVTDE
ncbi:MAG: hypothetical protein ABJE47_24690 [bacterium]